MRFIKQQQSDDDDETHVLNKTRSLHATEQRKKRERGRKREKNYEKYSKMKLFQPQNVMGACISELFIE